MNSDFEKIIQQLEALNMTEGDELSLSELRAFIQRQPSLEARVGYKAEEKRLKREKHKIILDLWFSSQEFKPRWGQKEQIIHAKAKGIYNQWLNLTTKLISLDHEYRVLSNLLSAIQTQGRLLQSLRVITQGNSVGLNKEI